ncbi:MAG: signal peptidase I, partial [Actinobacteria bacterium]
MKQDEDLGQIGAAGAGEKKNAEPFTVRWVLDWVVLIAIAFVLALGIKTFIVQPFVIPSGSMEPTIQIGDRVLVNRFIYRFTQPSS